MIIKNLKLLKDPQNITLKDLKDYPTVNILVPAWKENELFHECLMSIKNLNYPKIKVIVNAGGNDLTIKIAESFRKFENFTILRQTTGKSRAELGKIKALNDCLSYINEGLIYMIDADCIITEDIFFRIIYSLINGNEDVVISGNRPIKYQQKIDLVKYLQILRLGFYGKKPARYGHKMISGANSCIRFEVMKKIGKFTENRPIPEDVSRANDIISHGFNIYGLIDYKSRIFTNYPKTIKELLKQKKRYIENSLILAYQSKNKTYYVKFTTLMLTSFAILIFPFLFFIHFGFFWIGCTIILYMYLLRIRKLIFFKRVLDKEDYEIFGVLFYIKILYYIIIERIINIITLFGLYHYFKKIKKELSD